LTGIEIKAAEVKADVTSDDKAGLDELKKFYKARQAASDTMALNTLALAEKYPGAPVAITVGSAHAPRAADLLTAKGVSFAIIKPRSLDSDDEKDYLSDDALARKQKLVSVDEQGGLGRVLDNRWKPRPVLPKIWFRSEAQIKYLATVLARAVRRGERIPFEQTLRGEGSDLQYIKLDPNSFEMDGGDLIFRVDAQTDDSRKSPVPVYVRAKAIGDVSDKTLEQRLLEEREKTKQPPKLDADGLILTETSRDVIAKFAPDYATIKKKGLPSG